MALVFISHSSIDNEKTKKIADDLEEKGFKSFFLDFDENKGIKGGEDWEKKLYSKLDKCHVVLLLLSPAWVKSKWCFAEYTHARTLGKEIIPIIIEHGENDEVNNAISAFIQKIDATSNKNAVSNAIERIKEISLDVQGGFDWDNNRSPYPGMVSFEKEDAAIFFGREEETKSIIEKLNSMKNRNSPKLLNIVATSGMGKSSLLKAGVLATLELTYKDRWLILPVLNPSKKPFYEFTKILAKYIGKKSEEFKTMYNDLKTDKYQDILDDVLTDIEFSFDNFDNVSILIPIDQSEEFYTSSSIDEKEYFYKCFSYLLKQRKVFAVSTLRADFLKEYQTDMMIKDIRDHADIFTLSPIATENIYSVIKKPAKVAGITVDDNLIEKIKIDIQTSDALPLLALCLNELYQKHGKTDKHLTLNDYLYLGKGEYNPLDSIIKKVIDEAMMSFTDKEKENLKYAFIPHLVRVNERGEYIKVSSTLDSLPSNTLNMIEALVKSRLLLKKDTEISIAHEALLRRWGLLNRWLQQELEFLVGKSQLEIALKEWKEADVSEKDGALLSGLRLQKASLWLKENSLFLNAEEKRFIVQSSKHNDEQERKFEDLYNKAQEEVIKAKHNIGLVFVEKATSMYKKDPSKAVGYSYSALENLNYELDETEAIMNAKKILINSSFYKIAVSIDINITCMDVDEDKNLIVCGTSDGQIKLYSLLDGNPIDHFLAHDKMIIDIVLIQDNKKIISTSFNGIIKIWDIENKILLNTINDHEHGQGKPSFIILDEENTIMYPSQEKKYINFTDINSGKLIKKYSFENFTHYNTFKYDRKNIFMYSKNTPKLFNIATGELKTLERSYEPLQLVYNGWYDDMTGDISFIGLTLDKEKIIAIKDKSSIIIWNIKRRFVEEKYTFNGLDPEERIVDLYFIDDSERVILLTSEGTITLWDLHKSETHGQVSTTLISIIKEKEVNIYTSQFVKMHVSKDEKYLIVSSMNYGTINIYDLTMEKLFVKNIKVNTKIFNMVFSHINNNLHVNVNYNTENIIDLYSKKLFTNYNKLDESFLMLNKKLKIVESELVDCAFEIIDIKSEKVKKRLTHDDMIFDYVLSKDKKLFATSSYDGTIKIWNMDNLSLLPMIIPAESHGLVISYNNKYVFFSEEDNIYKWDIGKEEKILLVSEKTYIKALALSEDNTKLVYVANDKLKIFNTNNLELLFEMNIDKDKGDKVALSSNNMLALYNKKDNLIEIIDVNQLEQLDNYEYIEHLSSLYEDESLIFLKGIEFVYHRKWSMYPLWSKNHPFHWLNKAENGDAEAMYQLGLINDRDNENNKALEWYKRAENLGSIEAKERVEFLEKWINNKSTLIKDYE